MQTCSVCKEEKELDLFEINTKRPNGRGSWCRACKNDKNRFQRYGITRDKYEALLVQQNYECAICGTTDPGGNVGQVGPQFAVDHDHKTGELRGLLCRSCNVGIGNLGDDPERLLNAVTYLLSYQNQLAWAELPDE